MLLLHSEHNRDLAFLLVCFVFCLFFFLPKEMMNMAGGLPPWK